MRIYHRGSYHPNKHYDHHAEQDEPGVHHRKALTFGYETKGVEKGVKRKNVDGVGEVVVEVVVVCEMEKSEMEFDFA